MDEAPNTIPKPAVHDADRAVSVVVSTTLRIGLLAACSLMIIGGLVHSFQQPQHDLELAKFHSEPENLRSMSGIMTLALSGNGLGLMQVAVLMLVATPFLRVGFAGIAFAKQRDWIFVAVSCIVLGVLLYGLFASHALQ